MTPGSTGRPVRLAPARFAPGQLWHVQKLGTTTFVLITSCKPASEGPDSTAQDIGYDIREGTMTWSSWWHNSRTRLFIGVGWELVGGPGA